MELDTEPTEPKKLELYDSNFDVFDDILESDSLDMETSTGVS